MARMRWWSALMGLSLTLAAAPAVASVVTRIDLPEMVERADQIVVGSVSGAESVWIGRQLYTRFTIQVEETLQGAPTPTVSVLVPGGIDLSRPVPIGMAVADAPMMMPAERAVLLLAGTRHGGDLRIVGFNQGRFTIVGDRVAATGGTGPRGESLTAFRTRIRTLVARRGAR